MGGCASKECLGIIAAGLCCCFVQQAAEDIKAEREKAKLQYEREKRERDGGDGDDDGGDGRGGRGKRKHKKKKKKKKHKRGKHTGGGGGVQMVRAPNEVVQMQLPDGRIVQTTTDSDGNLLVVTEGGLKPIANFIEADKPAEVKVEKPESKEAKQVRMRGMETNDARDELGLGPQRRPSEVRRLHHNKSTHKLKKVQRILENPYNAKLDDEST